MRFTSRFLAVTTTTFIGAHVQANPSTIPARRDPQLAPDSTPAVPRGDTAIPVVTLLPDQGKLIELLKVQVAKAVALGRTPFIELGASWCAHCHALDRSFSNQRMKDALAGTYIIRLDVDVWKEQLGQVNYAMGQGDYNLPGFYAMDRAGKATGLTIGGGAWEDDIPENMAPPLKQFFREHLWQ
jgi:hypothetical protein